MIKISIDLIPYGDESRRRTLKEIDIVNTGERRSDVATYVTRCEREVRFVRNFERGQGVLALLQLALEQYQRKSKVGGDITDIDKYGHLRSYGFISIKDLIDFYELTVQKRYRHWEAKGKPKIEPIKKGKNKR